MSDHTTSKQKLSDALAEWDRWKGPVSHVDARAFTEVLTKRGEAIEGLIVAARALLADEPPSLPDGPIAASTSALDVLRSVDSLLDQGGYSPEASARHQLAIAMSMLREQSPPPASKPYDCDMCGGYVMAVDRSPVTKGASNV